jgi:hypothetical protein
MHLSRRASLHLLVLGCINVALRSWAQMPHEGEGIRSTLRTHMPPGWQLTSFEYIHTSPRPWANSVSASSGYAAVLENPDIFVNSGRGKAEHPHAAQSAVLRLWFFPLGIFFSLSRAQTDLASTRNLPIQSCTAEEIGHTKHLLILSDSGCGQNDDVNWLRTAFSLKPPSPAS